MMTGLRLDGRESLDSNYSSPPDGVSQLNTPKNQILHEQSYPILGEDLPSKEANRYADHIGQSEYRSSVLQLACAYQSVIKNYANIEQAALSYRASANEVTRECLSECYSPVYRNAPSLHKSLTTRNSPTRSEQIIRQSSLRGTSRYSCYVLPTDLVGPSRILLDQITSCGLQLLSYQPIPIVDRLSSKVFLGGVPIIEHQVTAVTRDQLQRGLEMFGTVTLVWPKGITVKSSSSSYYSNNSAFEVKRGHCYATFKDSVSVGLLLATCQRRNKGYYINLADVCPELKLSSLESIQIQIDPYLEDSLCCKCTISPGVYFCRDLKCFDYFCPACWVQFHPSWSVHKPIRRTVNSRTGSVFSR
ncbi:Cytoplasmic polyadenylation element binding [Fasciola gigantica]|uniref:Cytoplasmic polyadenylation element binding n=1 Tax=Fasciola gigantica TaxID=46835 RepID=A0A504Z369_FASGI|nr:Cytoplasmic polyadenylation element binding [Fasciola gigantica]